jgi:hypothetical protein
LGAPTRHHRRKDKKMDNDELKRQLEFEYYATLAANPDWKKTLKQYIKDRLRVGRNLKKGKEAKQ